MLTFDATEPRDNIYSMLSIAKDTVFHSTSIENRGEETQKTAPPIVADYQKSLLDVCKDFVAHCIERSGSVDIICRHWAPVLKQRQQTMEEKIKGFYVQTTEKLPSWISPVSKSTYGGPDNVLNGRVHGDSFVGLPNAKNYNATPGTLPIYRFGEVQEMAITSLSDNMSIADTDGISPTNQTIPVRAVLHRSSASSSSIPQRASSLEKAGSRMTESVPTIAISPLASGESNDEPTEQRLDGSILNINFVSSPISSPRTFPTRAVSIDGTGPNITLDIPHSDGRLPPSNTKSDGTLFVYGLRLAVIDQRSSRIVPGTIPRECLEMGGWVHSTESLTQGNREIPTPPDELWETLVAGRGPDQRNPAPWYKRAFQQCLAHTTANGDLVVKDIINKGRPDSMVQFIKRVQCVVWNRRFILSEEKSFPDSAGRLIKKRLLGLAPESVKPRDIICVILGCSVPVILRERKLPTGDYFELIGEAYISGMMDGEALSGRKMDDPKTFCEEFKLK